MLGNRVRRHKTTGVDDVSDDVLWNIFSRLPAWRMGRCRCVSKRWNALISDPNFMMSRSSKIFLDTLCSPTACILTLDKRRDSVKILDSSKAFKLEPVRYGSERFLTIVRTFSGIILLVVTDYDERDQPGLPRYKDEQLILYNPFTGEYDILDDPYSPFYYGSNSYGFGYGATSKELKIVRFRTQRSKKKRHACDVFNLKTRSWSQPEVLIPQDASFKSPIGTFHKGYLYWMNSSKITALDVDKMVISYIHQPDSALNKQNFLGTCHGCLWMITYTGVNFDVSVMKEQGDDNNSWSKVCSLAIEIGLKPNLDTSQIVEITNDGRIIISIDRNCYLRDMIIYDTSKHSYRLLKHPSKVVGSNFGRGIEYKESLTSPMNICRV